MRCVTTHATPSLLPRRVSVAALVDLRAKMSRSLVARTGLRVEVTGVRVSPLSATRGPKVSGTIMDTRAEAARFPSRCRFVRSGPFRPQSPRLFSPSALDFPIVGAKAAHAMRSIAGSSGFGRSSRSERRFPEVPICFTDFRWQVLTEGVQARARLSSSLNPAGATGSRGVKRADDHAELMSGRCFLMPGGSE
jgi:hypothetical protein